MTTVALLEDDFEFRAGLARLLEASGRYAVVGAFGSAEAALIEVPLQSPQILLCDINLPGLSGPAAVLRLREQCPQLRCVMLTIFDDAENLFSALQAGAAGYLLKSAPEAIVAGLDDLLAGGAPMSRPIARRVLASFARPSASSGVAVTLTGREREIMEHLARGLADKEIAGALGISTATVKNHLYRAYEKLAVHSRTEAVLKWLQR